MEGNKNHRIQWARNKKFLMKSFDSLRISLTSAVFPIAIVKEIILDSQKVQTKI